MSRRRLLIVGIDSLDAKLLGRFSDQLPTFRWLQGASPQFRYRSVYPPDSVTCWASIYTGLNPAKHGMFYYQDPLDKVVSTVSREIDNEVLRGKTFWDIAGNAGKRVCILFPHAGFPPWPVNGTMVARSNERRVIQTFPQDLADEVDLSGCHTIKGYHSRKKFGEFIEYSRSLVSSEAKATIGFIQRNDWDVLFTYSGSLDWVSHNLWMYFDEDDPSYPGQTPYKDVMLQFYRLYDKTVAEYVSAAGDNTTLLVLSDHGHGMRPTKVVNINEMLRVKGLLTSRIRRPAVYDPSYSLERLKGLVASSINRYGLGNLAFPLLRAFPALRRLYTAPRSVDWNKTIAHVTDLSGIKAYTYGGISILKENLGGRDYEVLREELVRDIGDLTAPDSGIRLVEWICRREDLYSGPYLEQYPDIVVEFVEGYGAGWSVHAPLIQETTTHNIQPGSHKPQSPVLLIASPESYRQTKTEAVLMDIAPTVLALLGVRTEQAFDGESLLVHK